MGAADHTPYTQAMDVSQEISTLIDGWCERRALHPLRIILTYWPPPNGFTDEWHAVWAALRHLRAMCREELLRHNEVERVDALLAEISRRLFPLEPREDIEALTDKLIAELFRDPAG